MLVMGAGFRLADAISLGVLTSSVPRTWWMRLLSDGRQARRGMGRPPPHVMVYFHDALALFADDDYEEVAPGWRDTAVVGSGVDGWEPPKSVV